MRRSERGFTLVELMIALAIVGALLAVAFGGLRVALAAWRQGEDRAEAHQHVRAVATILTRAVAATYPYRAPRERAPEPALLFRGGPSRIEFVTQAAPFPLQLPIAFTAVILSLEEGDHPGLVVRERALPNQNPFAGAAVVFRDPAVTALGFRYMDASGSWADTWEADRAMPRAVRISVTATLGGRPETLPDITVPLRTAMP